MNTPYFSNNTCNRLICVAKLSSLSTSVQKLITVYEVILQSYISSSHISLFLEQLNAFFNGEECQDQKPELPDEENEQNHSAARGISIWKTLEAF